jgi:hypothetical protein
MQTRLALFVAATAAIVLHGCGSSSTFEGSCSSNADCAETERCAKGTCGDSPGICQERPTTCPTSESYVCGCDGKTYLNDCEAQLAGVVLASTGACPCDAARECKDDEYCESSASCSGAGFCALKPQACEAADVELVCGCDGDTYDNQCLAEQAGVRISARASCECADNEDCDANEFCNADTCDGPGFCEERPSSCTPENDPVTGCDDLRYESECAAHLEGVRLRPDS